MVIANLFGIFTLLYLLWKRLKDDYHYEKIFNLSFIVLFGLIIGLIISKFILPQFWFWISLTTVMLGFTAFIVSTKIRFYESFEGLVLSFLPWISFIFLHDAVVNSSLSSFLAFWITLICLFVFFFCDSQYRGFTWYKSGRVGFAGLVTAGLFFTLRLLMSIYFKDVISLVDNLEVYFSATVAFTIFLLLYNLSRTKE